MEIRESARKHGIAEEDIRHAVDHALACDEVGPDNGARRTLWIGPDRAGNLVEIVVVTFEEGEELAVHAMKMRSMYRRLLPKER